MIHVEVEIDIDHPASKTFDFIANCENNPIWQSGMESCKVTTPGGLQVGMQYEQKAHFMGKEIISTFEIVEYEPGKLVKGKTIGGTMPITFTRMVDGNDNRSHVKAIVEGEPKGVFKVAKFLMKGMVRKSINKDYKRLKEMLEKG